MWLWAIHKSSANPNVLICEMEAAIVPVATGVKEMMHVQNLEPGMPRVLKTVSYHHNPSCKPQPLLLSQGDHS